MATSQRVRELLDRLAAAEDRFLRSEFLSPAVGGAPVRVRVAGVVCGLRAEPADFRGWGVWRPTSHSAARLARPASLAERQRYLELFPLVRLILCRRAGDHYLATPAHRADARFRFEGLVPVHLAEDGQPFEVVEARFDGARCWFERLDPRRDPAAAAYLRQALQDAVTAEKLCRPGLTAEERAAYALVHGPAEQDRTEGRLLRALAHAGADLKGYVERDDCFRVEYVVDGERHVSVVDKRNLSVQVAGICLSGEDGRFDLQSLVGVLREAQQDGAVLRIGADNEGMNEEHYWHVHPPR
jgi:hypothetical protein